MLAKWSSGSAPLANTNLVSVCGMRKEGEPRIQCRLLYLCSALVDGRAKTMCPGQTSILRRAVSSQCLMRFTRVKK